MSLLRLLSVLMLAIWVGGAAVLGGVAAPTIFSVLEGQDPEAGRTLAGAVFGAILARFQQLTWILGGLLVIVMTLRAALGPRPRRFSLRIWGLAAMLAASLTTSLVIAPRIDAIRLETTGPVAALPDDHPRKVEFGRLHGLSNGLMLFAIGVGVALIFADLKDH